MIDITAWMKNFLQALNEAFADRVWFVGLQGSYGRSEATDTSDVDVVVILDELSATDIIAYNEMLDTLPHRELICGFLSGKKEIMNWELSDLFQFLPASRGRFARRGGKTDCRKRAHTEIRARKRRARASSGTDGFPFGLGSPHGICL